MANRKEASTRIVLPDKKAVTIRVLEQYLIDDLLTVAAKAEAYRVATGRDEAPVFGRSVKDPLIKIGISG